MDIDRKVNQGDIDNALFRLDFVLSEFENDNGNECEVFMQSPISGCTIEEMLGAMVCAEQCLLEIKQDWMRESNEEQWITV